MSVGGDGQEGWWAAGVAGTQKRICDYEKRHEGGQAFKQLPSHRLSLPALNKETIPAVARARELGSPGLAGIPRCHLETVGTSLPLVQAACTRSLSPPPP